MAQPVLCTCDECSKHTVEYLGQVVQGQLRSSQTRAQHRKWSTGTATLAVGVPPESILKDHPPPPPPKIPDLDEGVCQMCNMLLC